MEKGKTIELFKGKRASNYDDFVQDFFPTYNFVINSIPKIIDNVLTGNKSKNILVAGCGTGNETQKILDYNTDWNVHACDPSEEMITIAKSKLKDYNNLELIQGTVNQIEFNIEYDLATLFLVLHFLSDDGAKKELLLSIAKRLKKEGKLIVFDICGTKQELKDNFEILSYLLPETWTEEAIETRRSRILNTINIIDEKRFIDLLKEAGFEKPVKFHQSTISRVWLITKT